MFFSRQDDNGLDAVYDTIEEVVLAAQGLQEVSTTIRELIQLASSNRRTTVSLTEAEAAAVKDTFAFIVCKGKQKNSFFCYRQISVQLMYPCP